MKGKGKGKDKAEEDLSTKEFLTFLKKDNVAAGMPLSKAVIASLYTIFDDGADINEIVIDEPIGEEGCKILFGALKKVK